MADDLIPPAAPPPDGPLPRATATTNTPLNIADELQDSYLTYAMSVIVSRALPDVRDGLKPSQRRILVAMNDLGLGPPPRTSKCAGIVGETMKRYHPHGDAVIYPTLVRMAQDWNMRHRLIHRQGNFGSIAGLPPAAMRYTEARLSPVAAEMLARPRTRHRRLHRQLRRQVPRAARPARKFPNLLVNGSDGIAVGMATDIPPHNLARGLRRPRQAHRRARRHASHELMEIIPGPDFPTGGIIWAGRAFVDGYSTGRGKITLRARADIDEEGSTQPDRHHTRFRIQQTRNRLAEEIGELVKDERIKGIGGVRDESAPGRRAGAARHRPQARRRPAPGPQPALPVLAAAEDGQHHHAGPGRRPAADAHLKEMLEEFLRHRVQVIRRRTDTCSREAKRRGHILEGQLIAIASIDEVIAHLPHVAEPAEAKQRCRGWRSPPP